MSSAENVENEQGHTDSQEHVDAKMEDDQQNLLDAATKPALSGFEFMFEDAVEELEEDESVEEEKSLIPRPPYYQTYLKCVSDYGYIKRLNNFFHKKMADYFIKRKMEHVLVEAEHHDDAAKKFGMRLDIFQNLIAMDEKQRQSINKELQEMKQTRKEQFEEALASFKDLIRREREIGTGLICEKNGKELPDKVVEKLISNQRSKAKELQNIRLLHIKIQNALQEKQNAIRALDRIGEKYTLMEFEQMKIENQAHLDKIEEREEELAKLRQKCSNAIQCLAHIREKYNSLEKHIASSQALQVYKQMDCSDARNRVGMAKQQRDFYRSEVQKMKESSGLLTKDKLLIDMEDGLKRVSEMETEIQRRKIDLVLLEERVNAIKITYEKTRRKKSFEAKLKAKGILKNPKPKKSD